MFYLCFLHYFLIFILFIIYLLIFYLFINKLFNLFANYANNEWIWICKSVVLNGKNLRIIQVEQCVCTQQQGEWRLPERWSHRRCVCCWCSTPPAASLRLLIRPSHPSLSIVISRETSSRPWVKHSAEGIRFLHFFLSNITFIRLFRNVAISITSPRNFSYFYQSHKNLSFFKKKTVN